MSRRFALIDHTAGSLIGQLASLIIVDDPHDYVVETAGVTVIKAPAMGKSTSVNVALHDMQFSKKIEYPDVSPYPERKKGRKAKQHMKGLRP